MKIKDKFNKKYTLISMYVIFTCIVIYILGLVATNAPTILSVIMEKLSWVLRVIKPLILGFIFAYLLEPVVQFFDKKLQNIKYLKKKKKSYRTIAIFITIVLIVLIFTFIISLLVFSVTNQLSVFNFSDLIILCNAYINSFNDFYTDTLQKLQGINIESLELKEYIESVLTYILNILKSFGMNFANSIGNLSGYLTTFIFSFIIMVYLLIGGKEMKNNVGKISYALLSDRLNRKFKELLKIADQVFSGYIRGQLADAFVMMILISLTLSLVGVKFGVVIGVLAGIGNLIPYCGPFVAYAGTALVCILNGQYKQLLIAIILLIIIQTIDGNIIGPRLLSKSIQIHPLLVMISLIFGSAIGGLGGMLLAVPVGAFIKVLFMQFIEYRIEQKKDKDSEEVEITEKKVDQN